MEANIELRMLTPLWTGGVETGKMDRSHETGIIGSLRWWYEAIVRGLGGKVCDITSDDASKRCVFEQKKGESFEEAYAHLCPVCQLFGATGLRRRFRLVVAEDLTLPIWTPENPINVRPPDRTNGWYLGAGRAGVFYLKIIADEMILARLLSLIQFIERYGSIGARPQLGYGFIQIKEIAGNPQLPYQWPIHDNRMINDVLPDLRTFTFFTLKFEPQQDDWWRQVPGISALARDNRYKNELNSLINYRLMPTTPALKNVLRYSRTWSSGSLPHHFFGTLRGDERRRSNIALSWAYQLDNSSTWQIRGWVYPPHLGASQKAEIQQHLQTILGKPEEWLRALKIPYRSAEISIASKTTFFQASTSAEIQRFVNDASTAKVQL